ncbi:hypothetical protein J7K28_08530 [Candidatus Aerophobetes bacterium]|nr:hypothetical protein [Candidatus Aerophobetes bacterium]
MQILSVLEEAFELVREYLLTEGYKDTQTVKKNPAGDESKVFDIKAEEILIRHFEKNLPDFGIISEESGKLFHNNVDNVIIIDPVDGSFNFLRGIRSVGCSMAVVEGKELNIQNVKVAFVGNVVTDDKFKAEKGHGAYLNNRRITTSSLTDISNAVLGIDLDFDNPLDREKIRKFLISAKYIRRIGPTSIELCYIANGAYDAYIDLRRIVRPESFFAASLIVTEAGGVFTDAQGKALTKCQMIEGYNIIAAGNIALHQKLVKLFKE